jgi:hypothetical protein
MRKKKENPTMFPDTEAMSRFLGTSLIQRVVNGIFGRKQYIIQKGILLKYQEYMLQNQKIYTPYYRQEINSSYVSVYVFLYHIKKS